jgi:hypothetical protein
MSSPTLASIHIHPIKSLGGFAVHEARLTDRGLEHDRRWMLVNAEGVFVTQRELPSMACLHTTPLPGGFRVTDTRDGATLDLPWTMRATGTRMASVWSDRVRTGTLEPAWSAWFTERLGAPLALVHMPDTTKRRTDGRYANGLTSLSDGFPYLIVSLASLEDLNGRLKEPVGMERFRPNLVIAGGSAFQEDGWRSVRIGTARFDLVKPCGRCIIITTDQRTGERDREPLRTLATYRGKGNKVLFGMNAVGDAEGTVRVGDLVTA